MGAFLNAKIHPMKQSLKIMKKITKLDNNKVARVKHLTNSLFDKQDKNLSESRTQLEKWLIGIACMHWIFSTGVSDRENSC